MHTQFKKPEDFTTKSVSELEKCLMSKTTVVLIYADYCGHCVSLRPEFEAFKKKTKHNVVEIESGALGHLEKHPKLYKKIIPKDGSMYFPMIIMFIKQDGKLCKKKLYEGERTAVALEEAAATVKSKTALKRVKVKSGTK